MASEEISQVIATNVTAAIQLTQLALPHLRKTQGNIIYISAWGAAHGMGGGHSVFTSSKGAITSLSKSLAIDEAPVRTYMPRSIYTDHSQQHVRVNSVSPSNIYTPRWKEWGEDESEASTAAQVQVLGRRGTVFEVAELCLFVAAEATYSTGVDYVISGGAELGHGLKTPHP